MKTTRPYARARPDKNHQIVSKALKTWGGGFSCDEFGVWQGFVHGFPVAAYDVSRLGGELPDWIVSVSWFVIGFEVKEPRPPKVGKVKGKRGGSDQVLSDHEYYWNMLKPGEEAYFTHSPMTKFIVTQEEDVWIKIIDAIHFVEWVDSMQLSVPFLNLFFPKTRSESNEQQFSQSFNRD